MSQERPSNKIDPYTEMANRALERSKDETLSAEVRARYAREAETWEWNRKFVQGRAGKREVDMAELEKMLREKTKGMGDSELGMFHTKYDSDETPAERDILGKIIAERTDLRNKK